MYVFLEVIPQVIILLLFLSSLEDLHEIPPEIGGYDSVHNTGAVNVVGNLLTEVPDYNAPVLL